MFMHPACIPVQMCAPARVTEALARACACRCRVPPPLPGTPRWCLASVDCIPVPCIQLQRHVAANWRPFLQQHAWQPVPATWCRRRNCLTGQWHGAVMQPSCGRSAVHKTAQQQCMNAVQRPERLPGANSSMLLQFSQFREEERAPHSSSCPPLHPRRLGARHRIPSHLNFC